MCNWIQLIKLYLCKWIWLYFCIVHCSPVIITGGRCLQPFLLYTWDRINHMIFNQIYWLFHYCQCCCFFFFFFFLQILVQEWNDIDYWILWLISFTNLSFLAFNEFGLCCYALCQTDWENNIFLPKSILKETCSNYLFFANEYR